INPNLPANQLEKMLSDSPVSSGLGDDKLRVWGIKMVADGGSDLAYLRKDYINRPGFRGQPGSTRENFITAARLCNKYGWRVGIHPSGTPPSTWCSMLTRRPTGIIRSWAS